VSWEVSPILAPLIADVKAKHPGMTVGTIGDEAHQEEGTQSDHNPDQYGFVTAADFMIGTDFSVQDAADLANRLRVLKDGRTAYVIYNRHIMSGPSDPAGDDWEWRSYDGSDPHTNHVHVSVFHSSDPRPTTTWNVYPVPTTNEVDMPLNDDDKAWITGAIKGLLSDTLGASGPNVGQDIERTEAIQATLAQVAADVSVIKGMVEEVKG